MGFWWVFGELSHVFGFGLSLGGFYDVFLVALGDFLWFWAG